MANDTGGALYSDATIAELAEPGSIPGGGAHAGRLDRIDGLAARVIGERAPNAAFVAAIPVSGDGADRDVTQPVPDPLDLEREFLSSARVGAGGDRTAALIGVRVPLGDRDVG